MRLSSQTQAFIITCLLYLAGFVIFFINAKTIYAFLSRPTQHDITSISLSFFSDKTSDKNIDTPKPKQKENTKKIKPKKHVKNTLNKHIAKDETKDNADSKDFNQKQDTSSQNMQTNLVGSNIDSYARKIYQLLDEAYYYPNTMRERGVKGEVKLRFHIDDIGNVSDIVSLHSDERRLEDVAMRIIKIASKKFPKPEESRTMIITLGFGTKQNLR